MQKKSLGLQFEAHRQAGSVPHATTWEQHICFAQVVHPLSVASGSQAHAMAQAPLPVVQVASVWVTWSGAPPQGVTQAAGFVGFISPQPAQQMQLLSFAHAIQSSQHMDLAQVRHAVSMGPAEQAPPLVLLALVEALVLPVVALVVVVAAVELLVVGPVELVVVVAATLLVVVLVAPGPVVEVVCAVELVAAPVPVPVVVVLPPVPVLLAAKSTSLPFRPQPTPSPTPPNTSDATTKPKVSLCMRSLQEGRGKPVHAAASTAMFATPGDAACQRRQPQRSGGGQRRQPQRSGGGQRSASTRTTRISTAMIAERPMIT